jgi:hypothetical protein
MRKSLLLLVLILFFSLAATAQVLIHCTFEDEVGYWYGLQVQPATNFGITAFEGQNVAVIDYYSYLYPYMTLGDVPWPGDFYVSVAVYIDPNTMDFNTARVGFVPDFDGFMPGLGAMFHNYQNEILFGWQYVVTNPGWYIVRMDYYDDNGSFAHKYTLSDADGNELSAYDGFPTPWLAADMTRLLMATFYNEGGTTPFFIDDLKIVVIPTILLIDGVETGIDDFDFNGDSLSFLINKFAFDAKNHGQFVSKVAKLANDLKKAGLITGAQKGYLTKIAAQSSLPK